MTEVTYYKFLDSHQTGRYSRARLPIGEWIKIDGPLSMCENGIHVTTAEHAIRWLDERAHIVDVRGERIVGDNKICCREVFIRPALPHWDRSTIVEFAADCAERVLPIFEWIFPNDDRPRKAIEDARSGRAVAAAYAANSAANSAVERKWQRDRVRALLEGGWRERTGAHEERGQDVSDDLLALIEDLLTTCVSRRAVAAHEKVREIQRVRAAGREGR